jgi:hypothetical protein
MAVRDFNKALANADASMFQAAQWLRKKYNCTVMIRPVNKIPDSGDPRDARDDGDIIAYFEKVVEVKEKPEYNFTGAHDFPFDTIMVANVEPTDRHNVDLWIIISGNKTHAAMIKGEHKKHFIKKNVWCPNTEKHEQKYMCPVEYVKWINLTD